MYNTKSEIVKIMLVFKEEHFQTWMTFQYVLWVC